MKELTKQEAVENHRKMWNWITEETLERKSIVGRFDYFREMGIGLGEDRPFLLSYCCEYDNQRKLEVGYRICAHCPLDWGSKVDSCMCMDKYEIDDNNGLLQKWIKEKDYKKCAELAREIANLEERK